MYNNISKNEFISDSCKIVQLEEEVFDLKLRIQRLEDHVVYRNEED